MKNLEKELKKIKEMNLTIFERGLIFKSLEKKYNVWFSNIVEIFNNI